MKGLLRKGLCKFITCMFACVVSVILPVYADNIAFPFSLTTTTLPDNDKTFTFTLSPNGTFYVDCGGGGVLTMSDSVNPVDGGTNVSETDGDGIYKITIIRVYNTDDPEYEETVDNFTYMCTYSDTTPKTIRFGGMAWGSDAIEANLQKPYARNAGGFVPDGIDGPVVPIVPAISFKDSCSKVAQINGDLAPIFPFFQGRSSMYPQFYETFMGCTHLTSIPDGLFGYTTQYGNNLRVTGDYYMFAGTFKNCTGLIELPPSLFSGIGGEKWYANGMFRETFYGCTNLSGFIPPDFFSPDMINGNLPEARAGPNHTAKHLMTDIFHNDNNLDTQCPADYYKYDSPYEPYWEGHVSCKPCPPGYHSPAGSTSELQCVNSYTITYYDDSSCSVPETGEEYVPTTFNANDYVRLPQFTRIGYYSSEWNFCSGTPYYGTGANIVAWPANSHNADLHLYKVWRPREYSISYNLNSGSWGENFEPVESVNYDTEFTVPNPTRTGYRFTGWDISSMTNEANTTTTHYYSDNQIIGATSNTYSTTNDTSLSNITATHFMNLRSAAGTVTFTATWNECDTENGYRWNSSGTACVNDYSVTYVADVPSGVTVSDMPDPSTETVSANTEYTLKPLPTATGYVLSKWSCKYTVDDIEQTLTPDANDKITIPPYDVTCTTSISDCDTGYHWTDDSHTACSNTLHLVWDTKGADNDADVTGELPRSCTYQTGTINLAFPTKTGYDFKGWKVVDWEQNSAI